MHLEVVNSTTDSISFSTTDSISFEFMSKIAIKQSKDSLADLRPCYSLFATVGKAGNRRVLCANESKIVKI